MTGPMTGSMVGGMTGAPTRRKGGGAAPVDPDADILALFANGEQGVFYDPSYLAGVWQLSDGTTAGAVDSAVGRLDDRSGNGNHLVMASGSLRPPLRLTSGVYSIRGDGADDYMRSASISLGQNVTALVAFKKGSTNPNFTTIAGINGGSFSNGATEIIADSASGTQWGVWTDGAVRLVYTSTAMHVVEVIKAGASITRRVNGASEATYTAAANRSISGVFDLGAPSPFSNNADFVGAIWINRVLTTEELATARTWLGAKAGLTI